MFVTIICQSLVMRIAAFATGERGRLWRADAADQWIRMMVRQFPARALTAINQGCAQRPVLWWQTTYLGPLPFDERQHHDVSRAVCKRVETTLIRNRNDRRKARCIF
jgi:hypothetical protein